MINQKKQHHPKWKRRVIFFFLLLFFLGVGTVIGQVQSKATAEVQQDKRLVEIRFEGDYLQLEELAKRLKVKILRFDKPFLYLEVYKAQLLNLRQEGYQPRIIDPEEFFKQLVRVEPPTDSIICKVREIGGQMVQREESYVVFRVNLKQLRQVRQAQIKVRKIKEGELKPRFVKITAPDESAVALVVSLGVDVFEAKEGIIFGRAYDEQIQALTEHGLTVKVVSKPPPKD